MTETDPQVQLHYEANVRALTEAQTGTEHAYRSLAEAQRQIAAHKRAEADLLETAAAASDRLAESVAAAAQAAADLGIMARHHDADRTLWVVQSEQKLNQERDSSVAAILADVAALKHEIATQAAYRERAEQSRAEMARLLASIAATLTPGGAT